MHRSLLTALIAIAAALGCAGQTRLDYAAEADKAMAESRWADAETALLAALHSEPANPTNVMLVSNLGMAQFYQGKDEEALANLTDAVNISPRSVSIRENRAQVLTSLGRFEEADADYLTLLAADSTLYEPRFYHAMLALRTGQPETARTEIERLETMAPDRDETRIARATYCVSLGDHAAAIPLYTRIIENRPEAEYYGQRAFCRLMTQDLHGASEDIGEAITLDPTDPDLYLYRAVLRKLQYRPVDADEDARRAIAHGIDPKRAAPLLLNSK